MNEFSKDFAIIIKATEKLDLKLKSSVLLSLWLKISNTISGLNDKT